MISTQNRVLVTGVASIPAERNGTSGFGPDMVCARHRQNVSAGIWRIAPKGK
jgi:hypothetical protein